MKPHGRSILPWVALCVLAALPYLGSFSYPLVHDDRTLLDNPWLRNEAGIVDVFRGDFWRGTRHEGSDLYRPLTVLTLAWNARLARTSFGFRVVNVALHGIVALLVAALIRAALSRLDPARARASLAAWAGAAIFAVHPLASEAVLAAVGRAELLAAALGIAGFLFLTGDVFQTRPLGTPWRISIALLCFFLALCAKESAAVWLLIYPAWLGVRAWRSREKPARSEWTGLAGLALVLAGFLALRGLAVGWERKPPHWVDNPLVRVDAATRMTNAVVLQARYVGKMIVPHPLSLEYGFDQVPVVPLLPWGALAAVALALGWIGVLLILARRAPAAAFFWVFLPLAFAVTGNFLFPIGTIFGERLAYLPLVAFCALAGIEIASIPGAAWRRIFAAGAILVAFTPRTALRARDYRSLVAIDAATAEASPRAVKALVNEGRTLLRTGQLREARDILERAVGIWPEYPRALELLSQAYAALGDPGRAADYGRRAAEATALAKEAAALETD